MILSRKNMETVVIGEGPDAVEVTVVDIKRGLVRIGFEAPRKIKIVRKELLSRGPDATEFESRVD